MRQYRYEATDETIEALRLLRGAWEGQRQGDGAFAVRLADGRGVLLEVETALVEPEFEAVRVRASVTDDAGGDDRFEPAADFAVGRNDVVVFAGATWMEEQPAGDTPALQFTGHPGQVSPAAAVLCLTTDAIVVASALGTGFLVRTGLKPGALDVSDDSATIARFLAERGYRES